MGAEEPMMRARQRGTRICAHAWCGPDSERPRRDRADDRREAHQAASVDLEPQECPKCGWYDYHPRSVLGRTCVWCRKDWG